MSDDDETEEIPYGDGLGAVTDDRLTIEVEVTEPTVIGHLLGPDGTPVLTLYDRTVVPFGFQSVRRTQGAA